MDSFAGAIWLTLIFAGDVVTLAGLIWWRGHGRPLPKRLEWARDHWLTRWLFALRRRPVLVGF